MRSELLNTADEIKSTLITSKIARHSGPAVYVEESARYIYPSEEHISVTGKSGIGKTQCVVLPFLEEIFAKGESAVVIDHNTEHFNNAACLAPEDHQKVYIDYRDPDYIFTVPELLKLPYALYKSQNPEKRHFAEELINELWSGVYSARPDEERSYYDAAAELAKGLTYGLFDIAEPTQISFGSIAKMIEESERTLDDGSTYVKAFYNALEDNSPAKRHLAPYAHAGGEFRDRVRSIAAAGAETLREAPKSFSVKNDFILGIEDIDLREPFAIFIIMPEETDARIESAGLFVSQLMRYLLYKAQTYGGKMPVRCNIILDKAEAAARSMPSLAEFMSASLGRELRLMLVTHSRTQLESIYGKAKTEKINSHIGLSYVFASDDRDTMQTYSDMCGETTENADGAPISRPAVSVSTLASMPAGKALVFIGTQCRFITELPFFDEMHDDKFNIRNREYEARVHFYVDSSYNVIKEYGPPRHTFDFKELIEKAEYERTHFMNRLSDILRKESEEMYQYALDLFKRDDETSDEEAGEQAQPDSEETDLAASEEKSTLVVISYGADRNRIADMIAERLGLSRDDVMASLEELPAEIICPDEETVEALSKKILSAGGVAALLRNG